MSLKTDSIKQLAQIPVARRVITPRTPRRLILPPQAIPIQELNYEELEFLIEELKAISSEKCQKSMGFLPQQKSKEDVQFGIKAHELANKLLDEPKVENVKKAKRFLKVNQMIKVLEVIAKERNVTNLGFHPGPNGNSDIKLADKACELANNLKISMSDKNITSVLEFITLVDLIKELEYIGQEKGKGIFGFHQEAKDEKHEVIEEMAFKLANALKEVQDERTIQTALEFIQLINAYDEVEAEQKQEESIRRNPCYGYHCSLN